jgi:hypothetical protein
VWCWPIRDRHTEPVRTPAPATPGGLRRLAKVAMTPDGQYYVHSLQHMVSKLFVVDGLA